jgi:hypothetical protein
MKVYVSITQASWPSAIMAGKTSGWQDVHIIRKLHLIYNLSMRCLWTDPKPIFFPPDTNWCYIMILVCVSLSLSLICIFLSTSIYPSTHPSTHPTIHPHHQHRDMFNTKYPLLLLFKFLRAPQRFLPISDSVCTLSFFSESSPEIRPLFLPYLFLMKR